MLPVGSELSEDRSGGRTGRATCQEVAFTAPALHCAFPCIHSLQLQVTTCIERPSSPTQPSQACPTAAQHRALKGAAMGTTSGTGEGKKLAPEHHPTPIGSMWWPAPTSLVTLRKEAAIGSTVEAHNPNARTAFIPSRHNLPACPSSCLG